MNRNDLKKLQLLTEDIMLRMEFEVHGEYALGDYLLDLQESLKYLDLYLTDKTLADITRLEKIEDERLRFSIDKSRYFIDQEEKWLKLSITQADEIARLQSLLDEKNKKK